jgi:hypothetical protein
MTHKFKKSQLATAVAAAAMLLAINAHAGGTISFGEDKSVSVGFGMRGSFNGVENGAPNGTSNSYNFSLDSARIYLSGSLNKNIKGMLNTEKDIAGEGFQAIDANVQIAFSPELTVWVGRFLSPSDRANMAGPYYSLGGGYWSGIASRYGYNGGYIGRDDGVAVVGNLMGGKLGYSFGLFEGYTEFKIAPSPASSNSANQTGADGPMYAGRIQYDFWDAEPGYYGTGNYLGGKDILAIGIAGRSQKNGAYSAVATGNYRSYSIDFLLEKKDVGPGALSIEAAAYNYDTGDVYLSEQGTAYSTGLGYIFNQKVGWGQFQPYMRYQRFTPDNNIDTSRYDLGVNYIIDGYNAQVGGYFSKQDVTGTDDVNAVNVAVQFQF